jgi:hypothetical protein
MKVNKEIAKKNIEEWFITFKEKLVDDFSEYRITFDYLITIANEDGVLYNVLETAYAELEGKSLIKGGFGNLIVTDYIKSLEHGFNTWTN